MTTVNVLVLFEFRSFCAYCECLQSLAPRLYYLFVSFTSFFESVCFILFPALTLLRVFLMFCILFVFFLSSLRFHSNVSFYVLFPFFVLFPIPVSPHPDTLTGQNKYYKPAKKERPGKWGVNGEAERVEEPHHPLPLPPLPIPPPQICQCTIIIPVSE